MTTPTDAVSRIERQITAARRAGRSDTRLGEKYWEALYRLNNPVEAERNTGKVDALGRQIWVDRYGRRKWRASDYRMPPGYTPDEWYRTCQIHGPVVCG